MESTLSLAYYDLQAEVGTFLGFGRGARFGDEEWRTDRLRDIDSCLKSGLRQFYYPPKLDGEAAVHDWSFLRPLASLAIAEGGQTIDCPDDWGGTTGVASVLTTDSVSMPWRIQWRNEAYIRNMYAGTPTASGPPAMLAEAPIKGTSPTQGQRFQLLMYPIADQDYTLQIAYSVLPEMLSGAFPYVYGGSAHTETVLESCKAMAEQNNNDMMGVHTFKFKERLAASVAIDRKHKSRTLGYNGDRSDDRNWNRGDRHLYAGACTYNGNEFT